MSPQDETTTFAGVRRQVIALRIIWRCGEAGRLWERRLNMPIKSQRGGVGEERGYGGAVWSVAWLSRACAHDTILYYTTHRSCSRTTTCSSSTGQWCACIFQCSNVHFDWISLKRIIRRIRICRAWCRNAWLAETTGIHNNIPTPIHNIQMVNVEYARDLMFKCELHWNSGIVAELQRTKSQPIAYLIFRCDYDENHSRICAWKFISINRMYADTFNSLKSPCWRWIALCLIFRNVFGKDLL